MSFHNQSPFANLMRGLGYQVPHHKPLDPTSPLAGLLRDVGYAIPFKPSEAPYAAPLTASPLASIGLAVPAAPEYAELRPESMMRSYQVYLADMITQKPFLLGAAEMSLGKTAATLTGVRNLLREDPASRAIIIGPLEVCKSTWPDEIAEWEHLQDLEYSVAVGTPKERLAALEANKEILIINRENLLWLWQQIGGIKGWNWNILVYDESSRLKGFTRRTKGGKNRGPQLSEFGVLAAARAKVTNVIELSGTPAPNGVYDLGGQIHLLDQGERLGRNKTQFENKYFNKNEYTYALTPLPGAEDAIMNACADLMIGLRSEDYIDLPPLYFNPLMVDLPPKLMKQYREFEDTLYSEEYDVEALSKGVLTNKLLQFSNGGLYRTIDETTVPPKTEVIKIHDLKIKKLQSVVAESAGQNILVAYSYKFDKAQIKKAFPHAVFFDEEPNFVKLWNAGKIAMGVAHPASIGHGLNLQHGGHIQVWYGLTWSLELWDQFNRRLARPGQKNPTVFVHVIMCRGTEDERQYKSLQTKGVTQDRITERVRVRSVA